MGSPIYNPPVPYTGPIPGGFLPGRMVRIQGRVHPAATYFTINLQTGPNPYDDVALHVNPRLNENVIVRNSRSNSSWGHEERHGPPMSIYRDQSFEILILSESSIFKIAVNGQHFAEFPHRVPVERVSYICVEGDLSISLIQFDGTAQSSSAYMPTAPPAGYAPHGGGGGCPYPPSSALPTPGFTIPVAAGLGAAAAYPGYPSAGAPAYPPPAQPYGGYPPTSGPGTGGYYHPQQPAGYPSPGQPGYYQPQGASHGSGSSGGGMLSDASKLLAGGLAGVGLAKVANKIPGMGGGSHGHHGGYPGYGGGGHHGGGGGGGILGKAAGLLGPAAALGVGGALAGKGHKKGKKNKLMKYGVPIGGAVVGGYALKKGMKGFRGGSSSSSSSSSEEE